MQKSDVRLVWEKVKDATVLQSDDGRYIFWPCASSSRWRWSLKDWPDDGIGLQHHGAADSLPAAVEAAFAHDREHRTL